MIGHHGGKRKEACLVLCVCFRVKGSALIGFYRRRPPLSHGFALQTARWPYKRVVERGRFANSVRHGLDGRPNRGLAKIDSTVVCINRTFG